MSSINIGGQEIPAVAIAAALPVLAALYVLDAVWLGAVSSETILAMQDKVIQQEAAVEEKNRNAAELKERTKQVDVEKAETAALEKSIALLRAKIPGEAQVPILLFDIERMVKLSDGDLKSFEPGELKPYGSSPGSPPLPTPPPPPAPKPKAAAKSEGEKGEGGAEAGAAPAAGGAAAAAPPPQRSSTADIMEIPVKIQAEATYPQLIKFLDQLGAYERKLSVSELTLAPLGSSGSSSGGGSDPSKAGATFKNMLTVNFTVTAYVLKKAGGQP